MKQLSITNIQRGCVYDGPGVRTTVFCKGCLLRCPWCCNPEALSNGPSYFFDEEACLLSKGLSSNYCKECEVNQGRVSISNCPFDVKRNVAFSYTSDDLISVLVKDKSLFERTSGGITFSGGEPFLQSEALLPVLKGLKNESVNIAFETSLYAPTESIKSLLPFIDCLIVDLKLQPQVGLDSRHYLDTLFNHYSLIKDKLIVCRMVFVDEVANHQQKVVDILNNLGVTTIDVLRCHDMANKKYQLLRMPHKDYSSDYDLCVGFVRFLAQEGKLVSLLNV